MVKLTIPFFDLTKQYSSIKDEIRNALDGVLEEGQFILGENVQAFEKEFASYCGVEYGVGVGSGTEALHLALLACGINSKDEVITVPNTAVATVSAICFANATPVFVDVDQEIYTIDVSKIEHKITEQTKAIIPVHLYGNPCDMDPVVELAKRYNLKIIEDCAQAHGAEYKDRKVGSIGDAGCFSFYPTKNIGSYGDGGMVLTNDPVLVKRLRSLRDYGRVDKNCFALRGFNSRLDEMQAAVLRVKLKYLDQWNEKRRYNAKLYNKFLKKVKIPVEINFTKQIYHIYAIRAPRRNRLQQYLRSQGIETAIHYSIPIHLQPAYKSFNYKEEDFPIALQQSKETLSLPIFPELMPDQIKFLCKTINNFEEI